MIAVRLLIPKLSSSSSSCFIVKNNPTRTKYYGFFSNHQILAFLSYPITSSSARSRTRTRITGLSSCTSPGKFSQGTTRLGSYCLKNNTTRIRSLSSMNTTSALEVSSSLPPDKLDRILAGKDDDHDGVIVQLTDQPLDPSLFTSLLHASLSHWKLQGKKGVWIKLPIELANLVEPAVKAGFYFHHAEPKYLMLVHWLPSTTNTIPANASHRVGIGAFVMNEKNEVLVVQEKSGRFRGTGIWKFPTGVVDEGEDISAAAVREVKEETGVDAKFVEILAFRQSHKSFFDKSDLFFVCMLRPLSFEIQLQETEIEAAQWMPFQEYAAQPFVQKHQLFKDISDVCLAKKDGQYAGFTPVPAETSLSAKKTHLYLNKHGLNYE
ncbi:nudix hydrolase 2-like isoform X1 [Coffea arabica]|uniref:Nudix hydrolase 2-like isoform X1 n=1 Tax=Coffea arabica TaxID=13443 RepID=A0A6P6U5N3_COFAR|nr:nudix hydrolase 2-like isoform X1 [Coffea arabica]